MDHSRYPNQTVRDKFSLSLSAINRDRVSVDFAMATGKVK
jgi:hypothetical protein